MNARFRKKLFVCPYEVLTTLNMYSHMFQEARARNCEAISTALEFTRKPKEQPAIVQTASA